MPSASRSTLIDFSTVEYLAGAGSTASWPRATGQGAAKNEERLMDERIQTFKERLPIVTRMVHQAFNGDAPSRDDEITFCLVARAQNGDVSLMGNIDAVDLLRLVLFIVAKERAGEGEDIQVDDELPGGTLPN
jgi:hypothetical protein